MFLTQYNVAISRYEVFSKGLLMYFSTIITKHFDRKERKKMLNQGWCSFSGTFQPHLTALLILEFALLSRLKQLKVL